MNLKYFFVYVFVLLSASNFVYSQNEYNDYDDNLNYLYFFIDNNSSSNKIAYEVKNEIENNLSFLKIEVYLDNKLINVCNHDFLDNENFDSYFKIICDIKNKSDGNYTFVSKLIDSNDKVLISKINREVVYKNTNTNILFYEDGNTTTISINVEGFGENLLITHEIPKEVFPSITKQNKNDLIKTDFDFIIIEEDPIIAWSVEKAPTKINYTINKRISDEDRENFKVNITEDKNFIYLKLFVFLLIILIIGISLKPILKK